MKLKNKVVLITGGASGIGRIMGRRALEKGAEALIRDVQNKINKAKAEMAETIEKVKLIDREEEQAEN
mgnify:CR=1 FL=1